MGAASDQWAGRMDDEHATTELAEQGGVMTPLVTIGMPVRNGARYIEDAIGSLLAQTNGNFVLHISDNCSDDTTPEICARLTSEDPRIRYERQTRNVGATANFEHVLAAAETPFFMWAAHDDWWAPEFLSETLELLGRNPDALCCVVGSVTTHAEPDDPPLRWMFEPSPEFMSNSPVVRVRAALKAGAWNAVYGLYRRDALDVKPLLHDVPFGDVLLVFRLALRGRFAVTSRSLQVFRYVDRQGKASGAGAHLYADEFTTASRLMWRYTKEARLHWGQEASIGAYVVWKWMLFTRHRVARANLEQARDAWTEGRYPRLALLLTKQLFLRPSDLIYQARRRL